MKTVIRDTTLNLKCIGESLFTLFASLTYDSLSDDANKIKTLNIERAYSFSSL